MRRVTSATLPIPPSSSTPHPPPAPVPPLSSDWNLETHLLPHHSSQLQPCQVVSTRLPSLSSLPFSPLTALSFLSLSSRRLLQALWRICPNYLSYWQLCVNKTKKNVSLFLSAPFISFLLFPFGPWCYLISLWTIMLIIFKPSHLSPIFFCLPSTSKSHPPPLVKGHYFSLPQNNCAIAPGGKNEVGDEGDLTCRETRHRHPVILPFWLYESEIATFCALHLAPNSLGWKILGRCCFPTSYQ